MATRTAFMNKNDQSWLRTKTHRNGRVRLCCTDPIWEHFPEAAKAAAEGKKVVLTITKEPHEGGRFAVSRHDICEQTRKMFREEGITFQQGCWWSVTVKNGDERSA
jgi:hypothetical protein